MQELPDQGLLFAYGNMIRYDPTLVDLPSYFCVLCTNVKVYFYDYSKWMELSMNIHAGKVSCILQVSYMIIHSGWSLARIFVKETVICSLQVSDMIIHSGWSLPFYPPGV